MTGFKALGLQNLAMKGIDQSQSLIIFGRLINTSITISCWQLSERLIWWTPTELWVLSIHLARSHGSTPCESCSDGRATRLCLHRLGMMVLTFGLVLPTCMLFIPAKPAKPAKHQSCKIPLEKVRWILQASSGRKCSGWFTNMFVTSHNFA